VDNPPADMYSVGTREALGNYSSLIYSDPRRSEPTARRERPCNFYRTGIICIGILVMP